MIKIPARMRASGMLLAVLACAAPITDATTTVTTTFTVTATIVPSCLISATNVGFGNYSPSAATALTSTSTVTINCTDGTPFTVALNVGTGGGAFTGRKMLNGSNTLTYNLYTTSGNTAVWGDGTGSTVTVAGTGNGLLTPNNLTVYGTIPTGQDVPTGTYTSTITASVTY